MGGGFLFQFYIENLNIIENLKNIPLIICGCRGTGYITTHLIMGKVTKFGDKKNIGVAT